MAVVVSDTSPIRALAQLKRLDVLTSLYGEVLVPPAVVEELASPAGAFAPLDINTMPQLHIQSPRDRARVADFERVLHRGESEALALALEVHAAAVLIDEADGRAAARRAGLVPIGVVGILIRAKSAGFIQQVRPLLDTLISELNFFISGELREYALREAGEMEDAP